jgi:hypothetical protein
LCPNKVNNLKTEIIAIYQESSENVSNAKTDQNIANTDERRKLANKREKMGIKGLEKIKININRI